MVDAGSVSVAPGDLGRVAADDLDAGGLDVRGHLGALEDPLTGMLVHAMRARALKAELRVRHGVLAAVVPAHQKVGFAVFFDAGGARFHPVVIPISGSSGKASEHNCRAPPN